VERTTARLVIHLSDGDRVVSLREGQIAVGRAAEAGIRLALPEVSTHHAELRWDGAELWMRDLSSANGTEVNGRRVAAWTALRNGDRIRWGPVAADVVLAEPAPAEPPEPLAAAERLPDARPSARRIFISHASEDKRLARAVAAVLRRQGWQPWIDESDILGGSSWAASIQQALRASSVVVLLVTANSVSKEWVLDEIVAARNLRVPIIPAFLEDVRLPDELRFMLQRTEYVDVSGLFSTSSDDRGKRQAAAFGLDSAILGVLERQGRLNPDRVRMRIGRVLGWIGLLLVLGGFAGFIYMLTRMSNPEASPVPIFVAMGVFLCGGIIATVGGAMVRSGRAKGL
jgi:TIR domain/FHA domain